MALERIDPFEREDRFCLDHLLRYLWARNSVEEKTVLDVACGSGFGTALLAEANADQIVGVDVDVDSIQSCKERFNDPNIRFINGNVENLEKLGIGPFDIVTCFETIEHVEDPEAAIRSIKSVMGAEGILMGSVPGETDWDEANEFHLQHFDQSRMLNLLKRNFKNIRMYRQQFHLSSVIEKIDDEVPPVINRETSEQLRIDFGHATNWVDTIIFVASDGCLPEHAGSISGISRQAWREFRDGHVRASNELQQVTERFRKLFFQHGDLMRRFTNVLAWGKYNFQKANGKQPEKKFLEDIEGAQSEREKELRKEIEIQKLELDRLKKQLREKSAEMAIRTIERSNLLRAETQELYRSNKTTHENS